MQLMTAGGANGKTSSTTCLGSRGTLLEEWMDDHQPHYESEPQRSFTQWVKSQPVYDRLYALYQNSRLSSREIEPLIRKYQIDMAEFEPVRYRSFAEFCLSTPSRMSRHSCAWETVSQPLAHSDSVLFQRSAAQAAASAPDYRLPLPPWELPAVSAVEGEANEDQSSITKRRESEGSS